MYPVSGSIHTACSLFRANRVDSSSALVSKVDNDNLKAAESLPNNAAVGLVSARSILLIIAFETSDRLESSDNDQPRDSRSSRIRSEINFVGSFFIGQYS